MSISTLTYFPLIEEVELDDEKTLKKPSQVAQVENIEERGDCQ